jgi:hypothetical protein
MWFGFRVHIQQDGVLRLSARATMVENELPGDEARHLDPQVFFDQRERQIDAGAGADRGPRPSRGNVVTDSGDRYVEETSF